ncbi:hypothetical protein Hypma_005026 [Hypsizygus marmoreus]|uniref:Uncharacterized protein n=1 Tax=Hypsizygus marmoreus TaxID=39966 RepID=A0A369K2H9_HYPMA|nr:hypothetical protein Hypma_005026 [Hypsizygus marmoreus]
MTPKENVLLQHLGISLVDGFAWLTALTLLYGVFILLFAISTSTLIKRGLMAPPRLAMFIVTLVTFLIMTLHWTAQLAAPNILIRTALINNIDLPLEARPSIVNDKTFHPNLIIIWTTQLLPIISDAVVMWRAWVLFPERRWVMLVPFALWIGTIATALAYLGLSTTVSAIVAPELVIADLFSANIALSMATNGFATLLIASHRKIVIDKLGLSRRQSPVQNVLLLLVESGAVYCMLQLVTLIMSVVPDSEGGEGSARYIAGQVFVATYIVLSAMYPTIVVVLVNAQRSILETYGFSDNMSNKGEHVHGTASRSATFGHLSFAVPPLGSAVSTGSDSGPLQTSLTAGNGFSGDESTLEKGLSTTMDEKGGYGRHTTTAPF